MPLSKYCNNHDWGNLSFLNPFCRESPVVITHIMTLKTKSIRKITYYGKPNLEEYWSFCQIINWVKCATKLAIVPPNFKLNIVATREKCILNELRSIDSILELLSSLTFNCKNKFTLMSRVRSPSHFWLVVWSLRTLSLIVVKVFFAHESITRGEEVKCYSLVATWV